MSKTPVQSPGKPRKGTRSFERRRKLERQRAARRRARLTVSRDAIDLRALLRRVPRAGWIVLLITILNAAVWSIIIPPFQGRDEVDHFAYVEHLAETGKLPHRIKGPFTYSSEETLVMGALRYGEVRFSPFIPSLSTVAEQEALNKAAGAKEPLNNDPQANGASSEPPLFYALQTVPYVIGGSNILIKLQLMRLLDVLMGGITALLIFFFVRETVPAVPWVATVAAICVALQPLFAFVTGSLNPDALIYLLSAATFLCLARGFRRQLTIPLAVTLGIAIAAGFVTYYSFIGAGFGAMAALVILAIRDARSRGMGRKALTAPAVAIGIGALPPVLDVLANLGAKHAAFGSASQTGVKLNLATLFHEISYTWQLFLPRIPGMPHYFEGISTWREIWFDRSVGFYGWMDTMFPGWVQSVALILAIIVAVLLVRELVARREEIRARLPELASYAIISVGVLVTLGVASYKSDLIEHELAYGEPRYLLPMLPLFAAAIALAIRGAGRRWVPVVGATMVVLFLGHDIFSQLQVIARYYG